MGYTQVTGKQAEDLACRYLNQQGLQLIERNFSTRFGEIDLVMRDRDTTVFVEVRYRKSKEVVDPLSSIDRNKQLKLIRTARYYLQAQANADQAPARFDVIAISDAGERQHIEWIRNAFEAQGY